MGTTYKLFAYGTLANRDYFQIITGKDLPRRPAVLHGFERVAELRAFPYIVPRRGASVEGVLIDGVDAATMAHLDHYEDNGHLYKRRPVLVLAGSEEVISYAYVGNPSAIAQHFGLDLEQADRVEQHLDEEIDAVLASDAPEGGLPGLDLRARRELMGDTISGLRHAHFRNPSWSPYIVRYSLQRTSLPSLNWLRDEPEAQRFAGSYLRMVSRLVVFNQTEERMRTHFRGDVRVADLYYHHTVSCLLALTFLNERASALDEGIRYAGLDQYRPDWSYLDYTREALLLADALYEHEAAAEIVARVNAFRQVGGTPLGAELEFSHLGNRAVNASPGEDACFDSFYYFHDFDLAHRLWKLGGYVDDHSGVVFDESRSRGFLEVAFGRLRVGGDLSRPATHDVWILSQLIHEASLFADVPPHSLHVSLQADPTRPFTRLGNPVYLRCLLLLGGDVSPDGRGVLREKRIYQKETINPYTGLDFSRLNSHRAEEGDERATSVVEFTFGRLARDRVYEPLILAMKGFQWATNPMPLTFSDDCPYRKYHREIGRDLVRWARRPEPLGDGEIGAFVAEVERGLEREAAAGQGHSPEYLATGLAWIESALHQRNRVVREFARHAAPLRKSPEKKE